MEEQIIFWSIVALILIVPPLAPGLRAKSWKRFFLAFILSFAGVSLPLFIFLTSAFLVPEWKGGCRYGWLDCFHVGKLALTPLVLWACAAFYVVQVLKPAPKQRAWVDLGLFVGATISIFCFIFGFVIHAFKDGLAWWLLVPLYVAIWYGLLCSRAIRASGLERKSYVATLLGTAPFWGISGVLSWMNYLSLPDNPPDCFVVTAALRGHEAIVGPLSQSERRGVSRVTNQQLRVFWQFERLWASRCPRTHQAFRRFYNWFGPHLAARIRSKFAADIVYVLLKPFEIIATLTLCVYERQMNRGCLGS